MAAAVDRVGALIDGEKRDRRVIVSPEGVPLDIQVATNEERLAAFAIDVAIMLGVVVCLHLAAMAAFFSRSTASLGVTLALFIAFVVRNCYFLHFEMAWQGRTPGKRACGLRVINRAGGELTPTAVIARNLTREVEFFLPLSLVLNLDADAGVLRQLAPLGWALVVASLPLWNRDRLRAGDLVAGTQVIAMPRRVLLGDLAASPAPAAPARPRPYAFAPEQLSIYGNLELQVLEEFLRRPPTMETRRLLADVGGKIRRKIKWEGEVPPGDERRFLVDFYAAERAVLERGQLFGRTRADKTSPAPPPARHARR